MNLFKRLFASKQRRSYAAAKAGRLNADWQPMAKSADAELRHDIRPLRNRARQLARDNQYVVRYLDAITDNVLGHAGIAFQSRVVESNGAHDAQANALIESAWKDWGRARNCTPAGNRSWAELQQLILRTVARDGSAILLKRRGTASGNRFGFSLQLLESDHIDDTYNAVLGNGHEVRMGVELVAATLRPVAYWLAERHPGDAGLGTAATYTRRRIPAEDILHIYRADRPEQTTGAPWIASVMVQLNVLSAYEEASLTASRIAACSMGFFTSPDGQGYTGEQDGAGNVIAEMEPGRFEQLPQGMDFKPFNPSHPTATYGDFVKACLLGISSGMGISYATLTGDLSQSSFSSTRAGMLQEREHFKVLQQWFVDAVVAPIFEEWLSFALLSGAVPLPLAKLDKFNAPQFTGRRWAWVDPQSDVTAGLMAINGGLTSRTRWIAENGGDIEEIFGELAREKVLEKENGLLFIAPNLGGALPPAPEPPAAAV